MRFFLANIAVAFCFFAFAGTGRLSHLYHQDSFLITGRWMTKNECAHGREKTSIRSGTGARARSGGK
jgi:hypothetical protein